MTFSLALGALISTMLMGQFNPQRQGHYLYGGLILTGLTFTFFGLPLAPTWQPLAFLLAGMLVGFGSGITESCGISSYRTTSPRACWGASTASICWECTRSSRSASGSQAWSVTT
ncbi:hypothetical protein [Ktedonobacter sp. SOSP1-52]|uniref:hypothetical protein n=1 Tax=Ktedonobacter sp. SOSP1-52 TaxID=2778366 RepID=UPI0019159DF5|nr:hypothetical protein [Ktedonobacter sp. SOSP1-52]